MFFIRKGIFIADPYRICYRVVDVIDKESGYPLSFTMKALPEKYETYPEAKKALDRENTHLAFQESIFNSYFENVHGYFDPVVLN